MAEKTTAINGSDDFEDQVLHAKGPVLVDFWGAGTRMPLAAGAHRGTAGQERAIEVLLITLSVAIAAACVLVLWGLRRTRTR